MNAGRPGRLTRDLDTARRWLADRPDVDTLRAVSANYGEPPATETLRGCAPILAAYGGRDRVFARKAPVLRQRIDEAGVHGEVTVYDSAGHSFMTDQERPPRSRPGTGSGPGSMIMPVGSDGFSFSFVGVLPGLIKIILLQGGASTTLIILMFGPTPHRRPQDVELGETVPGHWPTVEVLAGHADVAPGTHLLERVRGSA